MTRSKPIALIALPLLLLLLLPALASASNFYPPSFNQLDRGDLFKRGQLQDRAVYAEAGQRSIVTAGDYRLSKGTVLVNSIRMTGYVCPRASKVTRPSLRVECQPLGTKNVQVHQEVAFTAPASSTGSFLSVEQVSMSMSKGKMTSTYRWSEAPIFPANAVSRGQAQILNGGRAYGGAPVTMQQRDWRLAPATTLVNHRTEAWVCPNNRPTRDDDDMNSLGCRRVANKNSYANAAQTFTLSGRVAGRPSIGKRLYFQSFVTVRGPQNIGSLTYELRSSGYNIFQIPAPRAVAYSTQDTTVNAAFVPLDGVRYEITARRVGGNRIISAMCDLDVNLMECQLNLQPGSWRVSIIPKGKLATGKVVKKVFTFDPAPAPTPPEPAQPAS